MNTTDRLVCGLVAFLLGTVALFAGWPFPRMLAVGAVSAGLGVAGRALLPLWLDRARGGGR